MCVCVCSQQTAEPEKATAEGDVSPVMAAPVAAPVVSVAPPQPVPAKDEDEEEEEDIAKFREKVRKFN